MYRYHLLLVVHAARKALLFFDQSDKSPDSGLRADDAESKYIRRPQLRAVYPRLQNKKGRRSAWSQVTVTLTGYFCSCTSRVSVNCHPSKVSSFKCKLGGRRKGVHRHWGKATRASKSGTNGSIEGRNNEAISQRGRGGFLLGQGLEKIQLIRISAKKPYFCCDWSGQDPARSQWLATIYEGSYSGYAIQP